MPSLLSLLLFEAVKVGNKMILRHVALVCSSEQNCDKFYGDLLELEKIGSKSIPSALSRQIFGLDSELKIINYAYDNIHFEIFISSQKRLDLKKIEHVCLEVEDLNKYLEKCITMCVEILQIPKGKSYLIFVKDYDGNLFEIKEKSG